jgi:hypothetical protein
METYLFNINRHSVAKGSKTCPDKDSVLACYLQFGQLYHWKLQCIYFERRESGRVADGGSNWAVSFTLTHTTDRVN